MVNKRGMMAALTPQQQQLVDLLRSNSYEMHITDIYTSLWPHGPCKTIIAQQMRLGDTISKLNVRLEPFGQVVAPGFARNTYRLRAIQ